MSRRARARLLALSVFIAVVGAVASVGGTAAAVGLTSPGLRWIPNEWTSAMTLSPDGKRLYAANNSNDTLSVIDTSSGRVIAALPVGHHPGRLDVSPDNRRVYIAHGGYDPCAITEINAESLRSPREIPIGGSCGEVLVSADGRSLYVPQPGTVAVIDIASGQQRDSFSAPGASGPHALAMGGQWLVSIDGTNNTLTTYDLVTQNPIALPVSLPDTDLHVAVAPGSGIGYVTSDTDLMAIDLDAGRIVWSIPVGTPLAGKGLNGLAVSRDGSTIYSADAYDMRVRKIDVASRKITAEYEILSGPQLLAISPLGKRVYVTGDKWILAFGSVDATVSYPAPSVTATVGKPFELRPKTGWMSGEAFFVSPALPAGLKINVRTGVISGTPKAASPAKAYTVTLDEELSVAKTKVTIAVVKPTSTKLSLSAATQRYGGTPVRVTTTISPADLGGSVAVYDGSKRLATVKVASGKATYALPKSLPVGAHRLKAVFTPSAPASYAGSTSATLTLTVR